MSEGSNLRTVVLFPGALGDFLLALPALRALRARHAVSPLVLAVNGSLRALVRSAGIADAVASLDDAGTAGLFGGTIRPDWLGDRPRIYAWVGSRDPEARARIASLATSATFFAIVRDDAAEHAAAAYARAVGASEAWAGLARNARLRVPPSTAAGVHLQRVRRPVLAVHAGAGSVGKRWAHRGFAAVAARWCAGRGDVIEIVGPADHDLAPLASTRVTDLPLVDLAALLAGVDAYVGNDSGVSHLAAAVGALGVAVFCATDPRRWAPLGETIVPVVCGAGPDPDVDGVWSALVDRARW